LDDFLGFLATFIYWPVIDLIMVMLQDFIKIADIRLVDARGFCLTLEAEESLIGLLIAHG
jgi:hypothetical protein